MTDGREILTWAVLLGKWIEFARGAVALPDDSDGRRMRASVPDIIMLQAVWFALQQLDALTTAERALGIDRAEVLIDKHRQAIEARWGEQQPPTMLRELMDDAARQLAAASGSST